jgi:hypothetical protein
LDSHQQLNGLSSRSAKKHRKFAATKRTSTDSLPTRPQATRKIIGNTTHVRGSPAKTRCLAAFQLDDSIYICLSFIWAMAISNSSDECFCPVVVALSKIYVFHKIVTENESMYSPPSNRTAGNESLRPELTVQPSCPTTSAS